MPKAEYCPTCKKRMLRLYERDHGISRSKFYGYLWICPDSHTAVIDNRESKTQQKYRLEEVIEEDAST